MRDAGPFLIGIDLGTTNSAVSFVDSRSRAAEVELFQIPQVVGPDMVDRRPGLPSFLYFPDPTEVATGAVALPWNSRPDAIVGTFARDRGALRPTRQVASAKSWLAHSGVDRRAAFLPWGREAADAAGISPVDASARYLAHIRDAWDATKAGEDDALRFERQNVVLTLPASFDEEARELTVEAAVRANLSRIVLLEEPIAAFYAWLADRPEQKASSVQPGQVLLVCDVGGGTTDFSLIRVGDPAGAVPFERVAVGDHLLLGGDNVDLALANLIELRMRDSRSGQQLAITQRVALRRLCSFAKEQLLSNEARHAVPITVAGVGRAIIGQAVTVDLERRDVEAVIEQFLPVTAPKAPEVKHRAGLRELGLPYEANPAITDHLSTFLTQSADSFASDDPAVIVVDGRRMVRPDAVLFNGGFFVPEIAHRRVEQALARWFDRHPRVATTSDLMSAVARGAAIYARLRAGLGPAIAAVKAGSGRAYYIGVGADTQEGHSRTEAVCVLARGTAEGSDHTIDHRFVVAANRPVAFPLYSSTTRGDHVGDLVSLDPDDGFRELAPLVTTFRFGRKSRLVELPVRLSVRFTELGILEVWSASEISDHNWRLQFQARDRPTEPHDADGSDTNEAAAEVVISEEAVVHAAQLLRDLFDGRSSDALAETIVARLEDLFGYAKTAWPLPVIRQLADVLLEVAERRRCSPALEGRWLNLFGFCLRPGFGATKDPWRVAEARKVYAAGLTFPNAVQNRVEWFVLWLRAAGGLASGQQRELAQRLIGELGVGGKPRRLGPQIERESWRLLASLERLDQATRVRIGDEAVRRLRRDPDTSLVWSIGRLGARIQLYGPLTSVVSPEDAARWLERLLHLRRDTPDLIAAIIQIATRTGDPLRDVPDEVVQAARHRLETAGTDADTARPLSEVVPTRPVDTNRTFGEPLPQGLRLHR